MVKPSLIYYALGEASASNCYFEGVAHAKGNVPGWDTHVKMTGMLIVPSMGLKGSFGTFKVLSLKGPQQNLLQYLLGS